ncbi:hypothetical protein ACFQX6_11080 [Streptosporangium lutulentum]
MSKLALVTLSPAQERSIAESTARINIWTGSVRSGKTIASLLRWLMYVAQAPRGGHLVIVGKTADTIARNVFEPLMDPSLTGPIAKGSSLRAARRRPTSSAAGWRSSAQTTCAPSPACVA